MKRRFGVMLGIECDIQSGLSQRQAKEFTLAWAVLDQENGGMARHQRDVSAGNMPKHNIARVINTYVAIIYSYIDIYNVIDYLL
jgi:hypothetical protein